MANKVTGSTDTSGALNVSPNAQKSALVIGKVSGTVVRTVAPNTLFQIFGTADISDVFGATSTVLQTIVRILVTNGVTNIKGIIIETGGSVVEADAYAAALEASMQDNTIKCIIPEANDAVTIAALKDHLEVTESNDIFRYAVIAPSSGAGATQAGLIAFAATIDHDRVFVPGPGVMRNSAVADPQVFAAGLASLIMTETNDPALPMNGVEMLGFSGVSRVLLDAEKDALVSGGVTPIYLDGTSPTVYRLVTSKTTGSDASVWKEGTTRFIADYVLESIENMLRANYRRTKNVTRIINSIRSDIKNKLEEIEALEIIENFDDSTLTVIKDPSDQYGALVNYEFDVVTPLYTITINQHLKL